MINYESELAATIRNCDFQKLQDEMAKATKLACITVDYTGAPVTAHSCCTDFCALVRNHPEYKHLCEKCDSRGGKTYHWTASGRYRCTSCRRGD